MRSTSAIPSLIAVVAAALLATLALGAVLASGPAPRSAAPSLTATSDPAAYYAGRAMAGNGDSAVSLSRAEGLADQIPSGAQVDRKANTLRFTTSPVRFVVVASPPGTDMAFRVAGMRDPTIEVPAGAQVTVQFINGDSDMAHMWLLDSRASTGWPGAGVPIAAARPLGDPAAAGQPAETVSFTARRSGSYRYFCAFPGHAAQGMQGRFVVAPA